MRLNTSHWASCCLLLALVACEKPPVQGSGATQVEGGVPTAPASALSPAPITAPPSAAEVPSSASANTAGSAAAPAASAGVATAEPKPSDEKVTLLGDESASTKVTGCLASTSGMPDRAAPTAALGGPPVELIPGPKAKLVHHLKHACCLRSQTRVERAATVITVVEALSGTPCRCQCSSTLTTELTLPKGKYELSLQVEQGGAKSEVFRGPLDASGAPPAEAAPSAAPRPPKAIHVPAAAH
ncbi:MAG TPA: hypothetical protein VG937_30270 [Polyangiaceae bacterium]|nr:hypothetical protein [Polyangiaceae bacterium]